MRKPCTPNAAPFISFLFAPWLKITRCSASKPSGNNIWNLPPNHWPAACILLSAAGLNLRRDHCHGVYISDIQLIHTVKKAFDTVYWSTIHSLYLHFHKNDYIFVKQYIPSKTILLSQLNYIFVIFNTVKIAFFLNSVEFIRLHPSLLPSSTGLKDEVKCCTGPIDFTAHCLRTAEM